MSDSPKGTVIALVGTIVAVIGLTAAAVYKFADLENRVEGGVPRPLPVGAIVPYGHEGTPPPGWLPCNGDPIPQGKEYAKLREVMGSNVPDLRGMFLRGARQNEDERFRYKGDANRQVGSPQHDQFEDHTHNHTHNWFHGRDGTGNKSTALTSTDWNGIATDGVHDWATTGSHGDETRPNNFAVNFIVKAY